MMAEQEARLTAALQELLEDAENCQDVRQACQVLAGRLREFVDCERVALATCSQLNGRSHLRSISGVAKFDKHTPLIGSMEAALDESILRDELTVWPPESSAGRQAALAHHKLCSVADVSCVISSPLRNGQGELVGAWLFLGSKQNLSRPHIIRFLQMAELRVASCLSLLRRARRGWLAKLASRLVGKHRSWKARGVVVGLCTLMVALLLPIQYRIGCDCRLEPVTRRYVAAPYDGILERAMVTAGATVAPGDVLAKMDGREIRWELAGILAERDQALKQSEASFAQHDFASANVARLEVERLELKRQLLEARQKNLEVKSPINGMVVVGDLEKAQGAPVTCGQTLFEIAPLTEMVAELSIPENDIPYVREGQSAVLHLDACPETPPRGVIHRILPRSQIRDQENVFLAEVILQNADGQLRPGMQGSARIVTTKRTAAWVLLHKPWESFRSWTGW
jgi:multidrug efflux pump subunit AcrA (membrane-fusion protein)